MRIAAIAADGGFDCLWAVEHHDDDYSFCPDNLQLMSYLAAKHPNVDVGTAAVILPWNDPLRIAEKVPMIDHFTDGRLRFGVGRGLARREFNIFRSSMDESRTRFDEAAKMIVEALETGFIEGDGPHYKQPRARASPSETGSTRWLPATTRSCRQPRSRPAWSCSPTGPGPPACLKSRSTATCSWRCMAGKRRRP